MNKIMIASVSLGCGIAVGFMLWQKVMDRILKDEDFVTKKMLPILEKHIGKEKFDKIMNEIDNPEEEIDHE